MSFFYSAVGKKIKKNSNKIPINTLRNLECKACPLNKSDVLRNPKINPTGSKNPLFYILGEFPYKKDDRSGKHFTGIEGRFLTKRLPRAWGNNVLRFNTVTRCFSKNEKENVVAFNCCSPSLERDIQETKPWAIIGVGSQAIKWAIKKSGETQWRGRMIPIKIGDHVCWFFPLMSPETIISRRRHYRDSFFESEWARKFEIDLENIELFYNKHRNTLKAEDCYEESTMENILSGCKHVEGNSKRDLHKAIDWMEEFSDFDDFSIDVETQNLRPYYSDSVLLTVSMGIADKARAFPLNHPKAWTTLQRRELSKRFKSFLINSGKKICHNANMELEWFSYNYGEEIIRETEWDDTMSQAYVLDERKGMMDLDSLVLNKMGLFDLKAQFPLNKKNMIAEPLYKVLPYNNSDTKSTYKLNTIQTILLNFKENKSLIEVKNRHLITSGTIVKMQSIGLVTDFKEVKKHQKRLTKELKPVLKAIQDDKSVKKFKSIYRKDFDPRSDDTLILFKDVLKRKEVFVKEYKKGKETVRISVDEKVLKSIPEKITKLPGYILQMRSIEKLKSTYVDATYTHTYPDGNLHPNYNDKFTGTGRLSANDPNVQNYPKKKHKEVRSMVKAPDGSVFNTNDYGQIEARVIAMATQDNKFCDALWNGLDVHQEWSEFFIEEDKTWLDRVAIKMEIDRDDHKELGKGARFITKNSWVFPRFFGATDKSCAGYMEISQSLSKKLGEKFWTDFKGVKSWQEYVVNFYDKKGYVEMLTGRRRRGPLAYNEIINTPIQGTAADLVLDAMNRCSLHGYSMNAPGYDSCLNVHDDLGFYLSKDSYKKDIKIIASIMVDSPFDFICVPLIVESEVGTNWYDLKEYKIFDSSKMGV
jgi:DNA polymerase-1